MGCDIHAYIEYGYGLSVNWDWGCFAHPHIDRDHLLFSLLAGAREIEGFEPPPYPPRGVPTDISWRVVDEYTLYVSDEPFSNSCTKADAEKWGARKGWWNTDHTRVLHPDWHTASWLSLDELKHVHKLYAESIVHEWDVFDEDFDPASLPKDAVVREWPRFRHITSDIGIARGEVWEVAAIIACMETIEQKYPTKTRLVFWFDN